MAVRRRPVMAEFVDRFGEPQVIHRGSGGRLSIKRKQPTVVLALTHAVGAIVGKRVKEARMLAGMSMPELAERAGLKGGKQAIYHVEQALNTGVRIGTLYAIAHALEVSPLELLPTLDEATAMSGAVRASVERLAV